MMRALPSRRGVLLGAGCAVPLAACSLLPNSPAAQIYRLDPTIDDPPDGPALQERLLVDLPNASASLDTDRIALTRDRTRFDYYADSVWTDRAPVLLQALLIEAFENDGGIAEIGRDAGTMTPDYLLATELRDFEASYAASDDRPPDIVVELGLGLIRMADRQMIDRTTIRERAPARRNNVDAVVEAFDTAVGKVLAQSVAWTVRSIRRG